MSAKARGLYPTISQNKQNTSTKNYMNFLQYADGKNSLKKISKIIKISESMTKNVYLILKKKKLIT